jgi:Brp/Blh family beta-carotene 15,15'-monooxygenase
LFVSAFLSIDNQFIISFILIFSFGLIHGANDIQLIQKKTHNYSANFFIYSILLYVSIVIMGIFIFFYIPKFGLLFFIFFSSFHFGEQHLGEYKINSKNIIIKSLLYVSYGSIILGLLFSLQWLDAHVIIYQISELFISKKTMELYFYLSFTSFFIISLFYKNLRKFLWIEIILIVFLGYFFSKAPLLLSFSVYFVFWHSIPSILDQLKFLYKEDNSSKIKYLISSLPYWIMSVLGLFGFYFYFHTKPETFLPLFFSFLAAITFPHTIVMGWIKIYKPKTKE